MKERGIERVEVKWHRRETEEPVIGGDGLDRFVEALGKWHESGRTDKEQDGSVGQVVTLFIEWLLTTREGSVALDRINGFPRQLFLPFGDPHCPWKVVREMAGEAEHER